jgi:hypothetical protein
MFVRALVAFVGFAAVIFIALGYAIFAKNYPSPSQRIDGQESYRRAMGWGD